MKRKYRLRKWVYELFAIILIELVMLLMLYALFIAEV